MSAEGLAGEDGSRPIADVEQDRFAVSAKPDYDMPMPQEQPNITPLGDVPWADSLSGYIRRSLTFSIKATGCALLMFGVAWLVTRDLWRGLGGMAFVYAIGTIQAVLPSLRQGWKRFVLFWAICATTWAASLFAMIQIVENAS